MGEIYIFCVAIIFWILILFLVYKHMFFNNTKNKKENINFVSDNRNNKEFDEINMICEKLYNENYEKLIKSRNNHMKKSLVASVIVIICILIIIKILLIDGKGFDESLDFLYVGGLLLIILIQIAIVQDSYMKHDNLMKKNVIKKLMEYINPKLKYYGDILNLTQEVNSLEDRKKEIEEEYNMANFEKVQIELPTIKDYINGYLDGTILMETMEIVVFDRKKTIITNERQKRICLYSGNFTILNKGITNNYIKIVSRKAINVEMLNENREYDFEDLFEVTAKYEKEILDYLTLNLKVFLVEFMKKNKIKFDIVLKEKIYIKFYINNMFKTKLLENPFNIENVYKYYMMNKFSKELIENLNLE